MTSKNNELILDDKSFLVSETDEKGIIKFANDEFCEYAEFELDELIGKPHNIVRHSPICQKPHLKICGRRLKGGSVGEVL